MKLIKFVLIIFLVFGLLSIPSSVFAVENSVEASGSFLDMSPSNVFVVGFVPVLKGGKVSGDDINASLEIVDYKVYRNTFSDSDVKFEGYVKNNGKTSAEFVQINATGYDTTGNVIANKTTFVDDNTLLPGSTSPFGELSSYYAGYLEDPQKKIVRIKLEVFTTF